MASPEIGPAGLEAFSKLLEDPTGLNIPGTLSAETFIQEEVKRALIEDVGTIENQIIRTAIQYHVLEDGNFLIWLSTVSPCFPRFLSEFYFINQRSWER